MAEFNAQHWQNNNVGVSHHHLSPFMGMGSTNNTQINAAALPPMMTLDNNYGSGVSSDHHFPPELLDHSFFALRHHYHPQALASTPIVDTPAAAAAEGIPSCSSLNVNEKASSLIRRSRKKASDKDEVVHVRARKGQDTDSHSAAERVRREKINKKLRCLQELVPGCHKSMGMAVMLEEIINYVYSLQNQVEFLSMELAAAAAASGSYLETQPSRAISRPSLQGKNLAGREDYGDANSTNFHSTTTSSTTWSI